MAGEGFHVHRERVRKALEEAGKILADIEAIGRKQEDRVIQPVIQELVVPSESEPISPPTVSRPTRQSLALVPISRIKQILPQVSEKWIKDKLLNSGLDLQDVEDISILCKASRTTPFHIVKWHGDFDIDIDVVAYLLGVRDNYPYIGVKKSWEIWTTLCDQDTEIMDLFLDKLDQLVTEFSGTKKPSFILWIVQKDIRERYNGNVFHWLHDYSTNSAFYAFGGDFD